MDFLLELLQILVFPGILFAIGLAFVYEWLDRKIYARLQNRVGPLYTGPSGILQPFADFIKLLAKEDVVPNEVDKPLFNALPIFALTLSLTGFLALPITGLRGVISFNGDLIFLIALMTLICIVIMYSGISSANRFSTVGAERAALQLLGYEIPMMLSAISIGILASSMWVYDIVSIQANSGWFLISPGILGFAIFVLCGQAELERIPFDIPEAETEIVAGWLTEFSGRKLALFRLTKDVELLYLSGLVVALFLGGPSGPVMPGLEFILYPLYFLLKTLFVLFLLTTLRALFARLRIDQMVNFSWKYLVPLAILQVLIVRMVV
ncbi:MAG: complex I subunit 1/NuoH family protein [Nitrososphaerales archaeon]